MWGGSELVSNCEVFLWLPDVDECVHLQNLNAQLIKSQTSVLHWSGSVSYTLGLCMSSKLKRGISSPNQAKIGGPARPPGEL